MAGADYVAFGAFFPSTTKEPPAVANTDILTWWSELMELPCVAIGGITPENCPPLIMAGADFLAVSAAVWSHPEGPGCCRAGVQQTVLTLSLGHSPGGRRRVPGTPNSAG